MNFLTKQKCKELNKIFQEVLRAANWGILSLSYKWRSKGFYGRINKRVISKLTYPYSSFIKPRAVRKRIIYVFKFSSDVNGDAGIKK